jgi:hypothetical protein
MARVIPRLILSVEKVEPDPEAWSQVGHTYRCRYPPHDLSVDSQWTWHMGYLGNCKKLERMQSLWESKSCLCIVRPAGVIRRTAKIIRQSLIAAPNQRSVRLPICQHQLSAQLSLQHSFQLTSTFQVVEQGMEGTPGGPKMAQSNLAKREH